MLLPWSSDSKIVSRVIAFLSRAFCMSWVKGISLTSNNQLEVVTYLVDVLAAARSSDSKSLIINIKDEVMLPHQSAPYNHFRGFLNI